MTGPSPRLQTPALGPAGRWLRRLGGSAAEPSAIRLVCFPHAGGGASAYRSWLPLMPGGCELWALEYPGRGDRVGEQPPSDVESTARDAAFAVQWIADATYAVFGHSMGALLAHETCRQLERLGVAMPRHLFVSGSPPPDRAASAARSELGGSEVRWLHGGRDGPDREEMEHLVASTLRSDLAMLAAHGVRHHWKAPVPMTVVHGTDDPDLDRSDVVGWRDFAAAQCNVTALPGDHFHCFTQPHDVVDLITGTLFR